MVTLKEALELIHSGELISLRGVKYDKQRKKGGEIFYFSSCKKVFEKNAKEIHYSSFTFDIQIYNNGMPTSIIHRVHGDLLTKINDKQILL